MKKIVYISDKLKNAFPAFKRNLTHILENSGYTVKEIRETKDIWCRDYMPIKGADNHLVRFKYEPSYLNKYKKWRETITNVYEILQPGKWNYKKSNIKLDGGSIEILNDQGIISDRVFRDNTNEDEITLLTTIKRLLGLKKLTIIPQHPKDFTGHVDGLVRFIDRKTVLINDLTKEGPEEWVLGFKMALYNAGYKMESLPYRAYSDKGDDARGIYMNFLKLPDLIVMSTFTYKNEDNKAAEKLAQVFPGREIKTIYSTDLAKKGGIINCVTWTR